MSEAVNGQQAERRIKIGKQYAVEGGMILQVQDQLARLPFSDVAGLVIGLERAPEFVPADAKEPEPVKLRIV